MRVVLMAAAVASAAAPTAAFAVDYLGAEQAAKLMFPDADAFETHNVALDAAQLQQLEAQGVRARSAAWSVRVARRGRALLGLVITDDVIGKFELISYAGLGPGLTPEAARSEGVVTLGANFQVAPGVVVKADYQRFRENTDMSRVNLGLGWSF